MRKPNARILTLLLIAAASGALQPWYPAKGIRVDPPAPVGKAK